VQVAAETLRRRLREVGRAGKRAKPAAKADAPPRVEGLARIRPVCGQLPAEAALFFADELEISLWPKGGYQEGPKAAQVAGPPPGANEKRSVAGAVGRRRGTPVQRGWWRKTRGVVLGLLRALDRASPAPHFPRLYAVAADSELHPAPAVERGLAAPPAVSCSSCRPIARRPARLSALWARPPRRVPALTSATGGGRWPGMWDRS
jgi:hypothetical protein